MCVKVSDALYADSAANVKFVKMKMFFSNEYYNCKSIHLTHSTSKVNDIQSTSKK
jgi:hypothetical protein